MSRARQPDREDDRWVAAPDPAYPGERLGLPETGRASLCSWQRRVGALALDWAFSMAVAVLVFGSPVLAGTDWRRFMILATFFVESALLSALAGGSFGQLLLRIGILRLDGQPLGAPRAVLRAALVCLVLPALIVDGNRRGLHDLAANTVVVDRR